MCQKILLSLPFESYPIIRIVSSGWSEICNILNPFNVHALSDSYMLISMNRRAAQYLAIFALKNFPDVNTKLVLMNNLTHNGPTFHSWALNMHFGQSSLHYLQETHLTSSLALLDSFDCQCEVLYDLLNCMPIYSEIIYSERTNVINSTVYLGRNNRALLHVIAKSPKKAADALREMSPPESFLKLQEMAVADCCSDLRSTDLTRDDRIVVLQKTNADLPFLLHRFTMGQASFVFSEAQMDTATGFLINLMLHSNNEMYADFVRQFLGKINKN